MTTPQPLAKGDLIAALRILELSEEVVAIQIALSAHPDNEELILDLLFAVADQLSDRVEDLADRLFELLEPSLVAGNE